MSSISMDCPTLIINSNQLKHLLKFIYKHENILKQYGGFKIKLNFDCELSLKKRKQRFQLKPMNKGLVKINSNDQIYIVKEIKDFKKSLIENESDFWSSLSSLNDEGKQLNTSLHKKQSFFYTKVPRRYFHMHGLPSQSILKLGGNNLTNQFLPCIKRIHENGGIFPLNSTQFNLSSLHFHREGGVMHWFIIPNSERENLRNALDQEENKCNSICLDHEQLFLSPEFFEKYHIRYYKICQYPNEFIVLSNGTLTQSFCISASWSESIDFALPSWIEEDWAKKSYLQCQCQTKKDLSLNIDMDLFCPKLIQEYIKKTFKNTYQLLSLQDNNNSNIKIVSTTENIPLDSSNIEIGSTTENIPVDSSNVEMVSTTENIPLGSSNIEIGSTTENIPLGSSNVEIVSTTENIPVDSSNEFLDEKETAETNLTVDISLERILTSFQSFPTSILTTPLSNYCEEQNQINSIDNNDRQVQYQVLEEGTFSNILDIQTSDINMFDTDSNENPFSLDEFYETNDDVSTNIDQNFSNDFNLDSYLYSNEELMDLSPSTLDHYSSTYQQQPQSNQNTHLSNSPKSNITTVNEQNQFNRTSNNFKTLLISGLKSDVTINTVRNYFGGSTKTTIKKYRTNRNLKYAFVRYPTSEIAKFNLQRPIDFALFGPECRVQYSTSSFDHSKDHQYFDKKKLVISRIPENISEHDLQHLFINARIVKYSPARIMNSTTMHMKNKILAGFAFILFDNEQEAANVMKQPDQYKINGQPLAISFYRSKNHPIQQ